MINKDELTVNIPSSVVVPEGNYSLGIEVEFGTPTYYMSVKYRKEFNLPVGFGGYSQVLGYDGSGSQTKEYRSPVFMSESPKEAFKSLIDFSIEVQEMLIKDFHGKFVPYYKQHPMGIHFSVGGKFLDEDAEIVKRCKIIQPKLISRLKTEEDVRLFNSRDKGHYKGTIPESITSIKNMAYWNCNALRNQDYRYELRFFPSCDLESLVPYLEFVISNTNEPKNTIKFIK